MIFFINYFLNMEMKDIFSESHFIILKIYSDRYIRKYDFDIQIYFDFD